jgi:hypothetical protein
MVRAGRDGMLKGPSFTVETGSMADTYSYSVLSVKNSDI